MKRAYLITVLILSILGTLFAASVTLRQAIAPATEPGLFSCVGLSILGLSPCPYGLGLFSILTLLSAFMLYRQAVWLLWLRLTAVIGVGFSGWVVWRELCLPAIQLGPVFWETFSLARVPACAWGFLVFLAVALLVFLPRTRSLSPISPTANHQ